MSASMACIPSHSSSVITGVARSNQRRTPSSGAQAMNTRPAGALSLIRCPT
ncbi:Uncharacterised protein [Mycobacteroides abscessus subsp. abscessus]|nr:Uncharacterised protein [Mycobacteroides abscessus subsp. abscessus]SKU32120.1 Uncharacterised protein [Mycobacteroides abscessus subsp. abscessus]